MARPSVARTVKIDCKSTYEYSTEVRSTYVRVLGVDGQLPTAANSQSHRLVPKFSCYFWPIAILEEYGSRYKS